MAPTPATPAAAPYAQPLPAGPLAVRFTDAARTRAVVRSEGGDRIYGVSLAQGTCECPHHTCRGAYCKHLLAAAHAAGAVPTCAHCRRDHARQGSAFCSDRCRAAAQDEALLALPVAEEREAQAPAFAMCCRCGAPYRYGDERTLEVRLYCGACRAALRRAA